MPLAPEDGIGIDLPGNRPTGPASIARVCGARCDSRERPGLGSIFGAAGQRDRRRVPAFAAALVRGWGPKRMAAGGSRQVAIRFKAPLPLSMKIKNTPISNVGEPPLYG